MISLPHPLRRPLPSSDNILPNRENCEPVRLRDKSQLHSHQDNNNQDNYPTYYPAPLLSSPNTAAASYRWSEQLAQHATVAKLRTAISCHSEDLREMEFLLPHRASHNTGGGGGVGGGGAAAASANQSQPQLCISRHSQPKNAKLRDECDADQSPDSEEQRLPGDENASANLQHQLSVHRQPVQLRSKISGNTPHPRVSKMSKKQLKLAQAQLDKLTQSNIHLHGRHRQRPRPRPRHRRPLLLKIPIPFLRIPSTNLASIFFRSSLFCRGAWASGEGTHHTRINGCGCE